MIKVIQFTVIVSYPFLFKDLKEGCEYCNVKYGKEKLITQGCYNNLYIDKDEYDNLHIIAKADGIASFKIEYCPFCGRKLSEV